MKRTHTFVKSLGVVKCRLPSGDEIDVPVVPGILKHPTTDALPNLLKNPHVLRKYTMEALRKAPWSVLRLFPREWLRECIAEARLHPQRNRALVFLLS